MRINYQPLEYKLKENFLAYAKHTKLKFIDVGPNKKSDWH